MLMSEPPDRPGQVEMDPRYAFSASAVLEKLAAPVSMTSLPGATSDVLSGIGSSTSRNSSPSVSPERPSLEDALSLDDDSEGSRHDKEPDVLSLEQLLPPPPVLLQPRGGFLLPRSPARLFVHNAVVQSALSSVASSTAPVTLSEVVEQVAADQVAESPTQVVLDQIEHDIQEQLQVLDRIESDIEDGQVAQNEPMDQIAVVDHQPAVQTEVVALPAAIDSGVCELMANRGSDGDGQHTDQYSDAYITAVDSISSCDFGETPEPGNSCCFKNKSWVSHAARLRPAPDTQHLRVRLLSK